MSDYMLAPGARLEIGSHGKLYETMGSSDYMLAPGARLEIGPHGTPYETLGGCGGSCGKPCCGSSSLGDLQILGTSVTLGTVIGVSVAGLAAYLLLFRKHRKNPARRRRYRRHRR